VLAASRVRLRIPIASITKLMTVLVALDHARPGDPVVVSRAAANVAGSQAGLYEGQVFTVSELIEAALVPSANDAADALADGVSKGRRRLFVRWMNQKARALGMTDTHFVRPEGLDAPGHLSSARDVALLAEAAMLQPLVRRTVLLPAIEIGGRRLLSRNDLLRTFPGILGVKTGTTEKAGWSQVAAARRDAVTVYAVVLGSANRGARNRDVAALLTWGLDRYRTIRAIDPARVYARSRLPYGARPLDLVVAKPVWRVVRVDRPLVERVVAPATLAVPVRRGQQVGELRVYEGSTLVASAPLLAARSVARPAVGDRLAFYARRSVHHIWSWLS
jgi:D-alanyl-D-alanine carboxypeptidase (penicillin-binding protein 5/6)